MKHHVMDQMQSADPELCIDLFATSNVWSTYIFLMHQAEAMEPACKQ